jgi:hypothetical protein
VSEPKSISGKADGVSNEDDCGVPVFVGVDEGGEGKWFAGANMEFWEGGKKGTLTLKGLSLGSPFRGTEKVNEVFFSEMFSSWRRFRSSLRC